ncbi:hypothetical protein T492DRAFT_889205, partial [Pavlovales sp. CCMP2436]
SAAEPATAEPAALAPIKPAAEPAAEPAATETITKTTAPPATIWAFQFAGTLEGFTEDVEEGVLTGLSDISEAANSSALVELLTTVSVASLSSALGVSVLATAVQLPPPLPPLPSSPPSPHPPPGSVFVEAAVIRVESDAFPILLALVATLNALLVGLACCFEARTSPAKRTEQMLCRANARADVASSCAGQRLPLLLRMRFALVDNSTLLGIFRGESEPGLRRPELLQLLFNTLIAQLCVQTVFFSEVLAEVIGQPRLWADVVHNNASAGLWFLGHATVCALLTAPLLYACRLVFVIALGLSWRTAPWRIAQRMAVTAYLCLPVPLPTLDTAAANSTSSLACADLTRSEPRSPSRSISVAGERERVSLPTADGAMKRMTSTRVPPPPSARLPPPSTRVAMSPPTRVVAFADNDAPAAPAAAAAPAKAFDATKTDGMVPWALSQDDVHEVVELAPAHQEVIAEAPVFSAQPSLPVDSGTGASLTAEVSTPINFTLDRSGTAGLKVSDEDLGEERSRPVSHGQRIRAVAGWAVQVCAVAVQFAFAFVYSWEFEEQKTAIAIAAWAVASFETLFLIEPCLILVVAIIQHLCVKIAGGV